MEDRQQPLVRRFRELSAVRRGLRYAAGILCAVFVLVLLAPNPSSAVTLGAQLRNAAVHGFSDAASSLSGILIFAMNYGPSLLLWAAILFLPARYLWRGSRSLSDRTS
jgi:hypothetical protein